MKLVAVTVIGTKLPGRSCGPHRGVKVGLQVGKEVADAVAGDAAEARWIAAVTTDGQDWRGKAIHGPKGERFLYLVWLEDLPGKPDSMFRRAKLQLDGVPAAVVKSALRSGALVAELALTAADGLPVCASVRPPNINWAAGR